MLTVLICHPTCRESKDCQRLIRFILDTDVPLIIVSSFEEYKVFCAEKMGKLKKSRQLYKFRMVFLGPVGEFDDKTKLDLKNFLDYSEKYEREVECMHGNVGKVKVEYEIANLFFKVARKYREILKFASFSRSG